MKNNYAIEILERGLLEVCSPVLVSIYPDLTTNGKKIFKRTFKKQTNQLYQAIKILEESEEK